MRNFLLVGVVMAVTLSAFAQTATQASAPTYPDSTYFKFFFIHVARLQRAADALKGQGKDDMQMRNLLKNRALLTNQEFALLVSVASSCNAAYAAESKAGMAAARQLGQQYSAPSAVPQDVLQQINDLEAQRTQVLTNCMVGLQSQMGGLRYQALRNFVVVSEALNIQAIVRTVPAPPAKKPVPPPAN